MSTTTPWPAHRRLDAILRAAHAVSESEHGPDATDLDAGPGPILIINDGEGGLSPAETVGQFQEEERGRPRDFDGVERYRHRPRKARSVSPMLRSRDRSRSRSVSVAESEALQELRAMHTQILAKLESLSAPTTPSAP